MAERLQKLLARAGVASRREAERWILEGRVEVNGSVVDRLGVQVDPHRDAVRVDGRRVRPRARQATWLMLHKPRGYVTTASDPEGRPTVLDLVGRIQHRVFPVGRLDFASEGLLLLTDDGDLAHRLTHPSSRVRKTYSVKVRGAPSPETLRRLESGIRIDGRKTAPARLGVVRRGRNSWLEVVVTEGRKHHVRRLLAAGGHPVLKLRRVGYDGLRLGSLEPGSVRPLEAREVARLRAAIRG